VRAKLLENMINQPSSKLRLTPLGGALNRWRLAFLGFAIAYAIILLWNLTNPPIQWDEVSHLNGGNFLYWGLYDKFVNSAFYPPLFDVATFFSFKVFGVSLFAARLVPVVFSVLSLWAVFELAHSMYNSKTALLSVAFLAIMPAYFWLSQMAMLETMLLFFVTLSLLCFYKWLITKKEKMLVFSGLAIGLGFLTKYQMIVAAIIILLSILFLARNQLKQALKKFSLTLIPAILVVTPWIVIAYEVYAQQILSQWLYALQVGNPERSIYSDRFPMPIFYLIEMVWPYDVFHPISIFIYTAGLAGLVFLAWRHKTPDKYVLIWFIVIYIFFTLISNREWRYVLSLFPALAIAASVGVFALYGKISDAWKKQSVTSRKRLYKAAAGLLVVSVAGAMAFSIYDTYNYLSVYNIDIRIDQATDYAMANISSNKSIMVLCPFNFFSRDMVRFYLWADGDNKILVLQYPRLPVDTYTPTFNITEFIGLCKQFNVEYVFTYEYGGTVPYFNTTLNLQQIYQQLYASGNFTHISDNATFGTNPRRIFILSFLG
jgi:4-amino-4-deoxy-L-arabinose transferase-like glycosyltransferase